MMMQDQPMQGGPPQQMQGAGGQQAQIVQQLRQLDHDELVSIAAQAITRVQELEQMQGQGQAQPMG